MAERQLPKLRTRVDSVTRSKLSQPTSVARAQIETIIPIATIKRLRPIGARFSSFSVRGSTRGLIMAKPLPTTRAAPRASNKNGIKSGPRNMLSTIASDLDTDSYLRTLCSC